MLNSKMQHYEKIKTAWNGKRYFKASGADNGTKIKVINQNKHRYSVSAMCKVLKIARSTYYYMSQSKTWEKRIAHEKSQMMPSL